MLPQIDHVFYEHTPERLKVVMPVKPNQWLLVTYSALLLTWLGASVWMLIRLFGTTIDHLGATFIVVWGVLLLILGYIWSRLGGIIWRYWQYYGANREILYISAETLMIRRPVSILGITDAYDRRHSGPFYYQEKYQAIAFDYGSRGGLFGEGLPRPDAQKLIRALNQRYFPHANNDEEE